MSVLEAILYGALQGLTEFLPISSSGHLAIAQNLLGLNTDVPEFFDVLLHLGTLVAVFVAYWQDIVELVLEFFRGIVDIAQHNTPKRVPPARRMILLLIIATLPLFAVLPVRKRILALSDNMLFVGVALIITGFLLFVCDLLRKGRKNESTAGVLDVVAVGIGQIFATIPGISRSGMTISLGCFMGFEREFAVRFSFLMSIPAVLGANMLSLLDVIKTGIDVSQLPIYLVGVAAAAVSGYLCLRLLKYIAEKGRFGVFAYYCWAMGLFTLVMNIIR